MILNAKEVPNQNEHMPDQEIHMRNDENKIQVTLLTSVYVDNDFRIMSSI